MAFHRPKKSALILLIVLTLPFLDIIVDINFGSDEPLHNLDLKLNNTQKIGVEEISVFFFKFFFETTHHERAHVYSVQGDRAPPAV